ncbi:SAM-dependent DNA methyltransferase [Campylobacter jejuni]|nr:SAM-dependent DNA methyltransferase [Campylobacter jejuni]
MAKKKEIKLEDALWKSADKLRKNIDAAEYKHIVLGLIFLRYISDSFMQKYEELLKEQDDGADPEDADEYLADNIFFVPEKSRYNYIRDNAKNPKIGKMLDEAMDEIEKHNDTLKGVLPKVYAKDNLDSKCLGELIDLIGNIAFDTGKSTDVLGHVFEYFLGEFALAKGALTSNTTNEAAIRKALIEDDLIDCIVNLPAKLFLNTGIPASLWFIRRQKLPKTVKKTLFIDARDLGTRINRRNKTLNKDDINQIANIYKAWKNGTDYEDIKGFCKSVSIDEIRELSYVLTPGRYVGLADSDDEFDFDTRFNELLAKLKSQIKTEQELSETILKNLEKIK